MSLSGNKYLTPQGFQAKTLEQILSELSDDLRAAIDPLLNTDPDSPTGQLTGPFASQLREVWEILAIVVGATDPDAAEDFLLDYIAAITGTKRAKATPSRFKGTRRLTLDLNAATVVPKGTLFEVDGDPTIRFQTTEKITANVGAGSYLVAAECIVTGPVVCNANTLTVIVNAVIGLNAVNNPFDAEPGKDVDKDPELRIRREGELRATGSGNPEAIRADLLSIELEDGSKPVQECTVFSNDTDLINAQGLLPHSIEALIYDGLGADAPNDTVAQTLFYSKGAGIQALGLASGTATDENGDLHTVKFSRAQIKDVAFAVTIKIDATKYAGDAAAKAAMRAKFKARVKAGSVIYCDDYVAALMSVSGVIAVPNRQIAFNGAPPVFPPSGTDLVLGTRQIGNTQDSWIAISHV